jgi:cytochrome bd-type quinol oxidase subunit 2
MDEDAQPTLSIWWIVWAGFQSAVVILYCFLSRSAADPQPSSPDSLAWMAAIAPIACSAVIRWTILPRIQKVQTAFPLFVIGIALAEVVCFVGLFLFPFHQQEFFVLSSLGIFQFIPYFAGRFHAEDRDERVLRD